MYTTTEITVCPFSNKHSAAHMSLNIVTNNTHSHLFDDRYEVLVYVSCSVCNGSQHQLLCGRSIKLCCRTLLHCCAQVAIVNKLTGRRWMVLSTGLLRTQGVGFEPGPSRGIFMMQKIDDLTGCRIVLVNGM
ncbi:hypothetical protein TNCV_3923031 [Trichonephila clavipes]|nr:hypothetical protein TNCV_3923031 [Trichonephila clavipes]